MERSMEKDSNEKQTKTEIEPAGSDKPAVKAPVKKERPPKKKADPAKGSQNLFLKSVIVLQFLLLITAVAGVWYWHQNVYSEQLSTLQVAADANKKAIVANESTLSSLETLQSTTSSDLTNGLAGLNGMLEQQSKETQAVKENLLVLRDKMGSNDAGWKMAEVEYLVSLANQRVNLAKDKHTALAALKAADQNLLKLADPRLTSIRESIAREIQSLTGVAEIDVTGIVLELSAMEELLDDLPLLENIAPVPMDTTADQTEATSAEDRDWRLLMQAAWQDMKELIVIRHHDRPIEPLLPPEQRHNLIENMKLRLNAAKIAVLRGDSRSFNEQLKIFKTYLGTFFDPEHESTKGIISGLGKYEGFNLAPEFPDISTSLLAIRQFRQENR